VQPKEPKLTEGNVQAKRYKVGNLKIEVHPTRKAAGAAAADAVAQGLIQLAQTQDLIGVIFATGASQIETLDALTGMADLPWNKIRGFHMDEYLGIAPDHPASFRRYLRERLTGKVKMKSFLEMDGSTDDPERTCREYAEELRSADPRLCLLGIGENGHLAFNDPPVADFNDPVDAKIVQLDSACRQQQTAEGWFSSVEDVPQYALTLTIPTLLRVPRLIASVPGKRKAHIVRRALTEPISTACPATVLRNHPDATVYLDLESAAELDGVLASQ
jgi:glucosamine-6-phosphate deaminase